MKDRYFVDLFAGSGGLSLGLEQAELKPILVNEINKSAMETYLINRDDRFPHLRERYSVADAAELAAEESRLFDKLVAGFEFDFGVNVEGGELDLLVGGPPCQGFSTIGHRRTFLGPKQAIASNHLYRDMAKAISRFHPKLFLFENVLGLMKAKWTASGTPGEIWQDVFRTFQSLPDYEVHSHIVHAKDYLVPQNRPRVLIVGRRLDVKVPVEVRLPANGLLPSPTGRGPDLVDLLSDLIDQSYENGGETLSYPHRPSNQLQAELRRDPISGLVRDEGHELTEHKYSRHTERVMGKFEGMIASGGAIDPTYQTKKFSQRLLPMRWDERGPYITVTSLPDDYVHFAQPRTPTVREWARMQTFPDWYEFAGPRTTGGTMRAGQPQNGFIDREVPKYTQIGNAVPVALARAIGEHFRSILDNQD